MVFKSLGWLSGKYERECLKEYLDQKTDMEKLKHYQNMFEYPDAVEIRMSLLEFEWANNEIRFYVDQPLVAAILLNDQAAVAGIIESGPVIMSPGLECAIAFMEEQQTLDFIRNYGDVSDKVRLSAIYEAQNIPLLRRYLDTHYNISSFKAGMSELSEYLEWLNEKKRHGEIIKRTMYVQKVSYTEEFRFFKIFLHPHNRSSMIPVKIIRDIQKRLLKYLKTAIETEAYCCEIPWMNLNWDDLNDMDELNIINCVQYFMFLTEKYGPVDVSDEVENFLTDGLYALDMLRLKSGIKKNFVSLNQYGVQMSEGNSNAKIMQKKWMKRLLRYAIPAELREETDPITEWLIQRNDRKLVKKAIAQKYIGKKNAGKLWEYAVSQKNTETDSRILKLLETEMKGNCDAL